MGRASRKIKKHPKDKNYYLVDTCFLANKYIPLNVVRDNQERDRIRKCKEWWKEIDSQVNSDHATVYIPDICIAETFKVFAKKYYSDKIFSPQQYKHTRDRLIRDTHMHPKELLRHARKVKYHDIETNRDIVIGVKRFYEGFFKRGFNVSIVDLFIIAISKYLMDFYGFTRHNLFIVTIDGGLYDGAKQFQDVPFVFNPLRAKDEAHKVFI